MSGLLRRNLKSTAILGIGIFAGLTLSMAVPRVDAAQPSHNDLLNAINNVLAALQNAITDIGPTKSVRVDLALDPADGGAEVRNVIPPPDTVKTFSGHITGTLVPNGNNFIEVVCFVPGGDFVQLAGTTSVDTDVNEEFACNLLQVRIEDLSDSVDDPTLSVGLVVQYVESSDVTPLNS